VEGRGVDDLEDEKDDKRQEEIRILLPYFEFPLLRLLLGIL
jgi:hypothetical protein